MHAADVLVHVPTVAWLSCVEPRILIRRSHEWLTGQCIVGWKGVERGVGVNASSHWLCCIVGQGDAQARAGATSAGTESIWSMDGDDWCEEGKGEPAHFPETQDLFAGATETNSRDLVEPLPTLPTLSTPSSMPVPRSARPEGGLTEEHRPETAAKATKGEGRSGRAAVSRKPSASGQGRPLTRDDRRPTSQVPTSTCRRGWRAESDLQT